MTHDQNQTSSHAMAAEVAMEENLRRYLKQQAALCEKLESIADALPDSVDDQDCLQLAQALVPLVKRVHDFEENKVFPWLVLARQADASLRSTLERLRFEHLGDEEFASDLSSALRAYVTQRQSCNTEALAWMLRGFFEGMRRHIAFEREHILPLLHTRPAALQ